MSKTTFLVINQAGHFDEFMGAFFFLASAKRKAAKVGKYAFILEIRDGDDLLLYGKHFWTREPGQKEWKRQEPFFPQISFTRKASND